MARKMETPNGKLEFAKRKEAVEWPFGNKKENLKYTKFITRSLTQTVTEKKPNKHNTQHKKKVLKNYKILYFMRQPLFDEK